jgi:hypothetical protein
MISKWYVIASIESNHRSLEIYQIFTLVSVKSCADDEMLGW